MNSNTPGKPICSRIRFDSMSPTRPTRIAVQPYWTAITLWSWLQTYFVMKLWGSCEWGSP
jgi:hypothetical protein